MGCNCKWTEIIIALVVIFFGMWPQILGANISGWIVVIAGLVLFLHALLCKNCGKCMPGMMPEVVVKTNTTTTKKTSKKPSRRRGRKKKK